MSFLSQLYAYAFYFATAVLLLGLIQKIGRYARIPAPLKIPTTPAPTTQTGVVLRMLREVTLFESLFKSNKWIWLFGWLFHAGLFIVLARHLRYFTDPVWGWVAFIQPYGKYGAFAMLIGLAGLWVRRIVVDRVRYISAPSDHLMLALLIGIGGTGVMMTFVSHADIITLKTFFLGLMRFSPQPLPTDIFLMVHLSLVLALMIIFPFSKLLHAPGIFFSPTRNQIDNPREKRHVTPWAIRAVRVETTKPTGT